MRYTREDNEDSDDQFISARLDRPARLGIPRGGDGLIHRERLTNLLDELHPVTVVRSLPGSGKSTLVSDWARNAPSQVILLWVSVSQDLAERSSFLFVLERSLLNAGLLPAPRSLHLPLLVELEGVLPELRANRKVVLVLEGADRLVDRDLVRELVSLTARYDSFHLVACAQGASLIEAIAGPRVIGTQDLQFTLSEAVALAAASRPPVDKQQAELFHREVGGWAAPLRLLVQAAAAGGPTDGVVDEWLGQLLFSSVAPHTIESLLLLSLAEQLDDDLIHHVTRDAAQDEPTSDLLLGPGLLTRHQRNGRTVFEFPPLILRYLKERARKDHNKARELHHRLAEWYRGRRDGADAARGFWHAVASEDYELAHDIWAVYSPQMTMSHPRLYRRGLETLPPWVLQRFPGMHVALAATRSRAEDTDPIGRDTTFRAMAAAADRVLAARDPNLPLPDLLSVGTARLISLRRYVGLERARAYGAELAGRIGKLAPASPTAPAGLLAWFNLQRAVTATVSNDFPEAISRYTEAWANEPGGHRTHLSVDAAASLAMIHAFRGETPDAEAWLRRHDRVAAASDWDDRLASTGAEIAAGIRALDHLNIAEYQQALARLRAASDSHDLWVFTLWLQAQYGLRSHQPAHLLAHLERIVQSRGADHTRTLTDHPLLIQARAELQIAAGRAHAARDLLESSDHPGLSVPRARFLCLSGRPEHAAHTSALALTNYTLSNRDQLELLIISISIASRLGNRAQALHLVERAGNLAEQMQIAQPLASLPALDRAALALQVEEPPIFPDRLSLVELTRRERELLNVLVTSTTRKESADRLFVSMNTIKTQLTSLYRKLDARTQQEAIRNAQEWGLLPTSASSETRSSE